MRKRLLICVLLMLSASFGCSLLPEDKRQKETQEYLDKLAASQKGTVDRETLYGPPQGVHVKTDPVTGKLLELDILPAPTKQEEHVAAESQIKTSSFYSAFASMVESIPFGIKIALIVGALAAATFLVIWWRRLSATAMAGTTAMDELGAAWVNQWRSRATLSTDHKEIAEANAHVATAHERIKEIKKRNKL